MLTYVNPPLQPLYSMAIGNIGPCGMNHIANAHLMRQTRSRRVSRVSTVLQQMGHEMGPRIGRPHREPRQRQIGRNGRADGEEDGASCAYGFSEPGCTCHVVDFTKRTVTNQRNPSAHIVLRIHNFSNKGAVTTQPSRRDAAAVANNTCAAPTEDGRALSRLPLAGGRVGARRVG